MNKHAYETYYPTYAKQRSTVKQDPMYLQYHIVPESGWLNDPNGLYQKDGVYHVYYQYSPFDLEGKTKLWGHITSTDLLHWTQAQPVLFPDSTLDEHGVYSGSAFVQDDCVHFFYTGNVKLFDQSYNYINEGRLQNTIHVTSKDGYHFSEKELLMSNCDYPNDMSAHVRDPKIYQKDDKYFMVLGARDRASKGCVLVYESKDLRSWNYVNRISSEVSFGYMWECPDVFDLEGSTILLTCPQGVQPQGYDYANVHQSGYFQLTKDLKDTTNVDQFVQLDRGSDFYAPQTFEDEQGRRILLGWMGLPDIDYTNPTTKQGWQHALSIPRVLHMRNGRLIQEPVEEMKQLRQEPIHCTAQTLHEKHRQDTCFELCVQIEMEGSFVCYVRDDVTLSYNEDKVLTLEMGNSGYGREARSVQLTSLHTLQLFSDTSSLEIFVNGGEEVFTSRVYAEQMCESIRFCDCNMEADVVFYKLDGYTIQ